MARRDTSAIPAAIWLAAWRQLLLLLLQSFPLLQQQQRLALLQVAATAGTSLRLPLECVSAARPSIPQETLSV